MDPSTRAVYLSHSGLNNEFFSKSIQEWNAQLLGGERLPEAIARAKAEEEKVSCERRLSDISTHLRVDGDGHLVDIGFVCFLPRYCFVCPILLGQVGIWQNGQITLSAMVETTKSESTNSSP